MNIRKIHKSLVSDRFPLILSIVIFIALRLIGNDNWLAGDLWIAMIIQISIALSLLYLTQTFVIIRQRTLLPAFCYLLLVGTEPLFFYDMKGSVSALIIVFCLFFLFGTYQNPHSQSSAFNISLLLTLGSFYWDPLLFFFPLFWYGMYRFRSFTLKTFFASLMGFILIYLFIFTWSIFQNDLPIFSDSLPKFKSLGNFSDIQLLTYNLKGWLIIGFTTFLVILSGLKIFMSGIAEKIRTMVTLSFLYVFLLLSFIFSLFQGEWEKEWILILYVPLAFLIAHFFTLSYKKWVTWLFLFTIVFFLAAFGWDYIASFIYPLLGIS
ncbi:MAG: hypothetical protein LBO74_00315 [Candidatus Symbiothrix sp.]|jgi:hypothetical protein|nr:hypothetical protein [Candidatus Symbiothrix sp.]